MREARQRTACARQRPCQLADMLGQDAVRVQLRRERAFEGVHAEVEE